MSKELTLHINGKTYEFSIGRKLGQIPESETLLETLRERLGLTGTKLSCGEGACGCCAVLMDGKAVASCVTLTAECEGKEITTIEGLSDPVTGELDPIQEAFLGAQRVPVRLLHPRHHHRGKVLAEPEPLSHGRGDQGSAQRELLPLHQPLPGDRSRSVYRKGRRTGMSEFRHIGKVRRRQDGRAIVTGKALYCDDLPIKNC